MRRTGTVIKCPVCGTEKYRYPSEIKLGTKFCSRTCNAKVTRNGFKPGHKSFITSEVRSKITNALKGKIVGAETREKIRASLLGIKHTKDRRLNISKALKRNLPKGVAHWNWRGGGANTERQLHMQSAEYRIWRESVFSRDDFTCQDCHKRGTRLHAHHLKPYSLFPLLRLDTNNGVTLCVKCHNNRHKTTKIALP